MGIICPLDKQSNIRWIHTKIDKKYTQNFQKFLNEFDRITINILLIDGSGALIRQCPSPFVSLEFIQ